ERSAQADENPGRRVRLHHVIEERRDRDHVLAECARPARAVVELDEAARLEGAVTEREIAVAPGIDVCGHDASPENEIDRGPGSRERFDASPGLGWLLRAFCYCCYCSITSRGIRIAIGPRPHTSFWSALCSTSGESAAAGAGL